MSTAPSLPIRLVDQLIATMRAPVLTTGLLMFLPLLLLFVVTGVIYPQDITPWAANPLELTGLFLLLAVMPSYLAMCFVAYVRLSQDVRRQLLDLCAPSGHRDTEPFSQRLWPLSVVAGILNALAFNVGWSSLYFEFGDPRFLVSVCILFGQVFMWSVVGLILFFNIYYALGFKELGNRVPVDLYNLDLLNGFGRIGSATFLMIVGALALTTLQSIDQEFRWDNYRNALVVGVTASLIMVPLPIWPIHRRITATRKAHLAEVQAVIDEVPRTLDEGTVRKLNGLLERKAFLQRLRTWPMDTTIVTRFVLYVFIPPLAWMGSTLAEMLLEAYLGN